MQWPSCQQQDVHHPAATITFYSKVFTQHGMKPDLAKVQTIQNFPTPGN